MFMLCNYHLGMQGLDWTGSNKTRF